MCTDVTPEMMMTSMMTMRNTYVDDADLRKVTEALPFLGDVLFVSDEHDVFELAEQEVAGSERHDEVAQTDQRRMCVGEQTDDHVTAENDVCGRRDGRRGRRLGLLQQRTAECCCNCADELFRRILYTVHGE